MRMEDIHAPDDGLNYAYTYDNVSNILTKTTEHGNYGYGYDDVYRLTSTDNPALDDEAYTYDNVGNRDTASGVTGTIAHNANNELTVYGDISYDYDANGNMVRKSAGSVAVNYIYNVQHRLIRIEDDLSGLIIAEYGYDPFGRRLWKEVDGTRTYFFYANEGLVAEYDASGAEIKSYGYRPNSIWTTDPLFLKQGGEYYWYQNDHLGTPQRLLDSNGTVVWSATYTAFGEAQIQVETITNNLRFPGQYYDAETGLHYNGFRYYDARIGRYLRVDPIGVRGGDINWYGYVGNNPIHRLDAVGLWTAGDIADWYDDRVDGAIEGLDELTADSLNPVTHFGSVAAQGAMLVAGGFVDMLRLGEGVVEGGWGYGKDALRFAGFVAAGAKIWQAAHGGTATICGIAEAAELGPKVVNTKLVHAAERVVEHAGFSNVRTAAQALREFGARIRQLGIPSNTIQDAAGHWIIPGFGEGGCCCLSSECLWQISAPNSTYLEITLKRRS